MRGDRFRAIAPRSIIVAGDGFGDAGLVRVALVAGVGLVVIKLFAAGVTHGGSR